MSLMSLGVRHPSIGVAIASNTRGRYVYRVVRYKDCIGRSVIVLDGNGFSPKWQNPECKPVTQDVDLLDSLSSRDIYKSDPYDRVDSARKVQKALNFHAIDNDGPIDLFNLRNEAK